MGSSESLVYRRALLWVVGVLLLLMATIAASYVIGLRERAIERERLQLQSIVEDIVSSWEESQLKRWSDHLEAVAANPSQASASQRMLRRYRWFDSLFLWYAPEDRPAEMVYPVPAAAGTRIQLQLSQCIRRAAAMPMRSPEDVDLVAQALVAGCRAETPTVRLTAGVSAATLYMGQQRWDDALRALDASAFNEAATLRTAALQGVDPFRLASHRSQRAELLLRTGRVDEGLDLALQLGQQITDLDAPDLAAGALHMHEIPRTLAAHGRQADADLLQRRVDRAERRMRAYEEVAQRLLAEAPRQEPRFVYDQYSDDPYLLYYGWSNGMGTALVFDQRALLEDFLSTQMRQLRNHITVVDANRRWVAGATKGGGLVAVVPFTRTLTHLRVGVRQVALDNAVATLDEQWIVPLVVIALCVGLAGFALVMLDRTIRQQFEVLERQRAFSTRVTHELKTPLAGIKVMAENLEIGAFRDDAQRREMAHRIVEETDRLTERVDEVLAVARERTIPSPEPFDPEEVLYEAVDEWGPRLSDAGVQLLADVGSTDPVAGDAKAMRDAIACLLDNALKYRREDRADARVWIALRQEGRVVVLDVADNGIGVPKAMRKRIFDRFVRVEGPNRGKAGGHGLGLHQVREIATAHKGTVTCTDGVDGGARFVLRLPALRVRGR